MQISHILNYFIQSHKFKLAAPNLLYIYSTASQQSVVSIRHRSSSIESQASSVLCVNVHCLLKETINLIQNQRNNSYFHQLRNGSKVNKEILFVNVFGFQYFFHV